MTKYLGYSRCSKSDDAVSMLLAGSALRGRNDVVGRESGNPGSRTRALFLSSRKLARLPKSLHIPKAKVSEDSLASLLKLIIPLERYYGSVKL